MNADVISSLGSMPSRRTNALAIASMSRTNGRSTRRDDVQRRHERERGAVRAGDREVLGDHLARDDVQVDHDRAGRVASETALTQSSPSGRQRDERLEHLVQRGLGERTEADRADRDAELGGREHRAHVLHRVQARSCAGRPGLGQRLEGGAARGHGRELGTDEEGVAQQQEQRQPQGRGMAHRLTPSPSAAGSSPPARAGCCTRATRRPAIRTTCSVHPGSVTTSPTAGTRPRAAMTNPPVVSYAGPSGSGAPIRSRTSSGRHMPGTDQDPSASWRPLGLERSCSSLDLADDLLDDVLEGDDSGRPAVLVDDDGHLQAGVAQLLA